MYYKQNIITHSNRLFHHLEGSTGEINSEARILTPKLDLKDRVAMQENRLLLV